MMWHESSQTLTMGFGTTIFGIDVEGDSFLMALSVATDVRDTLNLDVQLYRDVKYSTQWFDRDEDLFQNSAAHMKTYHGQLSPKHQLDIRLEKGSEPGEGCWYVDINVILCEHELPVKRKSHSHGNRPSKSHRLKSIFS